MFRRKINAVMPEGHAKERMLELISAHQKDNTVSSTRAWHREVKAQFPQFDWEREFHFNYKSKTEELRFREGSIFWFFIPFTF